MPRNVVITPLSGLVDFYDLNSNLDAKIQIDDPGNLSITNSGGTLSLGNLAANVLVGDGVNNVDMIFEQNGAIRGATGRTLTLGSSASNVTIASPLTINSPIVNTTTTGYFEVRQTVSTWTSSNSHPIIKWDYNATYDDHLYLASGGNTGGTGQSALIIGETNISIGKANANPNSSSVLSTTAVTINASTGGISTTGVIISSGSNFRVATGSDAGGNLNLGRIDNVASLPYIDFNSGATTVDFDVRLQGGGGTGSNGGGTLTVTGNLSVSGNLTINGTTTTVNSTTVTIDDPIFTLGGDTAPTVDDNKDRGIEFRWHNGTAAQLGFFGFDDSTGYFKFLSTATNTNEVFSGTFGDIQAANFRGALVGNASTATTLATARNINGVSFNGSADITVTAAAGTLTGTTLASGVVSSSLTSVGTLSSLNVTGRVTASGGIVPGDTLGYANYDFLLDFGVDVANTWRKLVTVASPTGQYQTIGFKIDVIDPKANHATTNAQDNVVTETYYVNCVRTNDTVQDTPDACYVRGPGNRIRAVKTSTGNYEIQIQNEAQYREYRGTISVYAVNGVHTVTYHNGATAITGTAQYNASVSTTSTNIFQNIAARQITSSVPTGTAPLVVASTTAVTNLNADLLDGNHASAFYLATNPSGYTSNAGTVTSVGGTGTVSGLSLSGTVTSSGNLTLGGTLSVAASNFASQTANTVLIAPNGAAGIPTFRALVAADIPTLNQNTTGTAANVTGTVAIANGGTGATTAGSAASALGLGTGNNVQFNSLGVGTAGSGTAGEIRATNNITAYFSSDKTQKENIRNIDRALEKVVFIGGKYFDWTDEYIEQHGGIDEYFLRKSDFGVIAQDVESVFPIAVRKKSDGKLAVDYEKLCSLAFAAIKEQSEELNIIKQLLNKLISERPL